MKTIMWITFLYVSLFLIVGYSFDVIPEMIVFNTAGLWSYLFYKEMTEEPQ